MDPPLNEDSPFTPPQEIQQALKQQAQDFHPVPFSQNPWNCPEFSKRYTRYVDQQQIWGKGEEDIQRLLTLFPQAGLTILDIGCGTGRHSLQLAEKKHFITGIDSCAEAILIAKERNKSKNVSFEQTEFLAFCATQPFDLILILCALVLNISPRLFPQWIHKAFAQLKPGGSLVIELPATLPLPEENFLLDDRPLWYSEKCWVYHRSEVFSEQRLVLDSFLGCTLDQSHFFSNSVTRHYYQEKDFLVQLTQEAKITWHFPETVIQKHPWLLIQKK